MNASIVDRIKNAMLETGYNRGLSQHVARGILISLAEDGIDIRTEEVKDAWIEAFNRAEDIVWGKSEDKSYSTSISDSEAEAFADAIFIAEERGLFKHTYRSDLTTAELFNVFQNGYEAIDPENGGWMDRFCELAGITKEMAQDSFWNGTELPNDPAVNEKLLSILTGLTLRIWRMIRIECENSCPIKAKRGERRIYNR